MTESVETGDIPPKITADASAEARDRPRENEGEKQPLEKQSTDEAAMHSSPLKESEEERAETANGEDGGVKEGEVEHLDVSEAKDSKVEADEKIKLSRRRRRCPVVDVDRHISGGAAETKEGAAGKRRTLAQVIMQEDITGLIQLLRGGASVSETDSHGWNPLHWSSSRGNATMTYIILQEIKPAEETGSDDDTDEGTSNRFDYLNATEGLSGWTPLHLAAIGGHVDVVYLLMEAGCNSRVQDRVGDRPINCIKRATKRQGGLETRLRNALLDLSDTESGDEAEGSFRGGDRKKQPAPRTRQSNRERRKKH